MKKLLIGAAGLFILTGTGMAIAEEGLVQTNKPLVKTQVQADDQADVNTKMTSDKVDVNETDSIEVNKAAIRDNDVNIRSARKDVIRDTQKLSDDQAKLSDAQTKSDDQAAAKAKTEIDADKNAIDKDRERLEKHLAKKIENDKTIVRKYEARIQHARKEVARDTQKLSEDTSKLADAQAKNAADEIDKKKSDVENDKAAVDHDTVRLNNRIASKASYVLELKKDRRHLDAAVKHLNEADQASADVENSSEVADNDSVSK